MDLRALLQISTCSLPSPAIAISIVVGLISLLTSAALRLVHLRDHDNSRATASLSSARPRLPQDTVATASFSSLTNATSNSSGTGSSTLPSRPGAMSPQTQFFGSQVGGAKVINYGYTDLPWNLLLADLTTALRLSWAAPWILFPLRPCDSDHLDELYLSRQNIFCIVIHVVLCVLQLGFILCLPFTIFFPLWMVGLAVGVFFSLNWLLCRLLNGPRVEYHSSPRYAEAKPEHAHEQWIFLNGVAVGSHWMQSNLDRLALTFKRPILGIHNSTSGIIFDLIECLVQRSFCYATTDIRVCYKIIKEKLYSPEYSKVIFILHSQGGIEGGMVLDWLLQELPQDLLGKLEVYTFGNAANHFNNPHRHVSSQLLLRNDPLAAMMTTMTETTTHTPTTPISSPLSPRPNGAVPHPLTPLRMEDSTASISSVRTATAAHDRAIGHVEHYAHKTDFVAMWGVLFFSTATYADHVLPRFIGRLFVRSSDRGGHQFCQHYLDGMFPLARNPKGELIGAAESNEFMESVVEAGAEGDAAQDTREAWDITWMGDAGFGTGTCAPEVEVHGSTALAAGKGKRRAGSKRVVRVKDVSRLWQYRNGKSPSELPPLLYTEGGIVRNATL